MDIQLAKQLQKYANEAIENAREISHIFDESINWSDLSCVDVEYIQSLHGKNSYYRILVEEAAPGSAQLCEYITAYILLRHIHPSNFEVVTEW